MQGLRVGHFTKHDIKTGVSVFLFEQGAVGAYYICGSAPASHELAVLDADNSVPYLYGLAFTGGSAYGLYAALGVMTFLTESHIGHPTIHGVVPIVPAAAIYDLSVGTALPPVAEDAYQACLNATASPQRGQIGAGCGALVGKLIPDSHPMTGGIGYASHVIADDIEVSAYAVVNCVGDVKNEQGDIIAGARDSQDTFLNCEKYLLSGRAEYDLFTHANTTLVAVFTNAQFSKSELKRIAKMAIAGIARSIAPIFTKYDGDILFCISVGDKRASELTVGTVAAHVVQQAIMDAVKTSETVAITLKRPSTLK